MLKKSTTYLILLFCLLLQFRGECQKKQKASVESFLSSVDDRRCLVMNVRDGDVAKLKTAVQKALKRYYFDATLLDNTGIVTKAAVQRFKDLCENDAKLTCDYSTALFDLSLEDYTSTVAEFLPKRGIPFTLNNPKITKIYEKEGYYFTEVEMKKTIYVYLDANKSVITCKKGRVFKMILTYRNTIYDFENALIDRSQAVLLRECSDSNPAWGWNIESGSIAYTTTVSDLMAKLPSLAPKLQSGLFAKLGAYYYKSLGESDRLWIKYGCQIGIVQSATTLQPSAYSILNTDDSIGHSSIKYSRFDRRINLETEITELSSLLSVSIPIAIRYKLYQSPSEKWGFGVEAGVSASAHFNLKTNWSGRLSYVGFYTIGNNIFQVNQQASDGFGLKPNVYFDESSRLASPPGTQVTVPSKVSTKFNPLYTATLCPYFEWTLSDKSMVQLGFPISYGFNNFFKHSNTSRNIFAGVPASTGSVQDRINEGTESSITEDVFKTSKALLFGVQLGVVTLLR